MDGRPVQFNEYILQCFIQSTLLQVYFCMAIKWKLIIGGFKKCLKFLRVFDGVRLISNKYGEHWDRICPWSDENLVDGPDTCPCVYYLMRKMNYYVS